VSENKISGIGAFFYPPSSLQESDDEQMHNAFFGRPIKLEVECSDDFKVFVTDDCFVCPITEKNYDVFLDEEKGS